MKKRTLLMLITLLACLLIFSTASFAATGHEDEATKITKDTTSWSGWMIAEGKIEINANVEIKGACNLILADDAELTVNGQIYNIYLDPNKMLNIYASDAGTGVLNVKCSSDKTHAFEGNLCLNGGTVNIDAGEGKGNYGIFRANNITVNDGTLNVMGAYGGGDAVRSCVVTVNGGEMNIEGGYATEYGGNGTSDTGFTVNGGVVTVIGGDSYYTNREIAYDGEDSWNINVKAYASENGIDYKLITKGYNKYPYIKFYSANPVKHKTPYIDEFGSEKTADAALIDEGVLLGSLQGWYYLSEDLTTYSLNFNRDVSLIIADGVNFEILGTLNTNGHNFDIYSQKSGDFKMKISSDSVGATGRVKICAGETEIVGGKNSSGISICVINVTGTAKVSVNAGNGDDVKGACGADKCSIYVAGDGELTIKGGMGTSEGGFGVSGSLLSVTDNGVLIISGGDKPESGSAKGDIFDVNIEAIQAKIFTSDDGVNYTVADEAVKNNPLLANSFNFVKLTDVDHTYVSYLDENGDEKIAKDPTIIDENTKKWSDWMVVNGNVEIFNDVVLEKDTNLILADGARLLINGGTLNNDYYKLKIYAQSTGNNVGKLTVKATDFNFEQSIHSIISPYGIDGDVFIYGGNVEIFGGYNNNKGYAGIHGNVLVTNGNVTITGGDKGNGIEGNVEISGGKMVVKAGTISGSRYLDIDENEGASGIKGFRVRVSGGELFAHGSGSGYGIEGSNIFVTGGVAILTGDNNYSSYSLINDFKGCAYSGNISEIDAFVEISDDGKIYYPYGGGNNGLILRDFPKILRLTPKSNEYTRNTGDETNLFVIVSFVTIFSMCTLSVLKFHKKED